MGATILSRLLASCTKALEKGEEPRISHFIATVNSEASADKLSARFTSDRVEVIWGDNVKAMKDGDLVLLAFKPYMIDLVLKKPGVREALAGKLVISVLVGSPTRKFEEAVPPRSGDEAYFLQRAMPNPSAEFGEAMTIVEVLPDMPQEHQEMTTWIFSQCGKISLQPPELYDIGGVVSGVSVALLSVAFDGMLDGAVNQGLKRGDAKKILSQALFSMAKLLEEEHPAVLREKFSSPKGTTIDGILSLEEDRVRFAFSKAVIAASKRSHEIGK